MSKEIKNGPYEEYHPNGQLRVKCTYKDGQLDGPCEEYDYDGQLTKEYTYKNDKLDGIYTEYDCTGELRKICIYTDGQLDGSYAEYDCAGQLRVKCTYKDGQLDGPYEEYNYDGELSKKCTYKNDKLDGIYTEYDCAGELRKICAYKNGIEITEEEYKRLTQNESAQVSKNKSNEKTTSEIIEDKSKKNEVSPPQKYRSEKCARMMGLQESARCYASTFSETIDERHALAVDSNNLRQEFGCSAEKITSHSKTIKALRKKTENHR